MGKYLTTTTKKKKSKFSERSPSLLEIWGLQKFGEVLPKFAEKIVRAHPSGPDAGILEDLKSEIIRSAGGSRGRQDSEICTNN